MAKKTSANTKSSGSSSSTHTDCPKRPLSAYNMFFQLARQRVVGVDNHEEQDSSKQHGPYTRAEIFAANFDKNNGQASHKQRPHRRVHGRISFIDLAKTISSQWNALPVEERRLFEERADEEKRKYAVELEAWLIKQSPTPQIKKRLGALRRGALGKFIKAHHCEEQHQQEEDPRQGTKSPPPNYPERKQDSKSTTPMMSPSYANHRPTPIALAPRRVSNDHQDGPYYHPPARTSRNLQMQRARNLERLYRMQIQLYEEQVRLHEESRAVSSQQQEYHQYEDYHRPHHPHAPHTLPPPRPPVMLKPTPPVLPHHTVSPPASPPYYEEEVHYVRGYPQDHPTSYLVPNIATSRKEQPWQATSSRLPTTMTSSSSSFYDHEHDDMIDSIDDNDSFSHPQELTCWQEAEQVEDNLDNLILAPVHDDEEPLSSLLPPLPLVGSDSLLLGDFGLVAVDPFDAQD